MRSLLGTAGASGGPIYVISRAELEDLRELHLFEVKIYFHDKLVYSEVVGVGVKPDEKEIIRGRRLLKLIAEALHPSNLISSAHEYYVADEFLNSQRLGASKTVLGKVVHSAVKEFLNYTSRLEKLGLSDTHQEWEPRNLAIYSEKSEYIGSIIFTENTESGMANPPSPAKVKEVEEAAMKIAIEYEIRAGRIPEDVSMREHYDIISRDPVTGEIRYIEVKGKSSLDLEIELTEAEFNVAREKGEAYWLYIVYGISTGRPRLLAVRDPVNSMTWKEVSVKRYRFRATDVV